jgi:integrase
MAKLPQGIYRRKVCWKCPERVPLETGSTAKKNKTCCAHEAACPEAKKYEPDYWIRYFYKGRIMREHVGPNRKTAEQALASRKGEVAQGRFKLEDVKPSVAFRAFMEETYLPHAKDNKKSWDRDGRSAKHLVAFFEDMPLGRITQWTVEQYKSKRLSECGERTARPIANGTVNRELSCLRHAFTKAVEWELVESNPVSGVKFMKETQRERFLSLEEIAALIEACSSPQLRAMVVTALHTGMRKSEILGLRWEDVDMRRKVIRLSGECTKNGEPRLVEVNSVLEEELREYRKHSKSEEYLFLGHKGRPIEDVRGRLYRAFQTAGITDATFHTLRHTWASHQVMLGTDLLTLQKMGGWKSLKMVARYSHLSREHQRKAAERYAEVMKVSPVYSKTALSSL